MTKMIKKLDDTLFAYDNTIFINEDTNNVTFFGGEMGILSIDQEKINLHMLILMKMILKLLFMSHIWHNRYKQCKSCKKDISKKLLPVV